VGLQKGPESCGGLRSGKGGRLLLHPLSLKDKVFGKQELPTAIVHGVLCCVCVCPQTGEKETSRHLEVEKQSRRAGALIFQARDWALAEFSQHFFSLECFGKDAASLRVWHRLDLTVTFLPFPPLPVQWRRRRPTWRSPWRRTSTGGCWRRDRWRPGRLKMPLPSSGTWPCRCSLVKGSLSLPEILADAPSRGAAVVLRCGCDFLSRQRARDACPALLCCGGCLTWAGHASRGFLPYRPRYSARAWSRGRGIRVGRAAGISDACLSPNSLPAALPATRTGTPSAG